MGAIHTHCRARITSAARFTVNPSRLADDDALTYSTPFTAEGGHGGPFNGFIHSCATVGSTATSRVISGQVFSYWAHSVVGVGNVRFEVLRASDNTVAYTTTVPNSMVSNITSTKQAESTGLILGSYYCRITILTAYSAIDAFYSPS